LLLLFNADNSLGILFKFVEISIKIGKTPSLIRAKGRKKQCSGLFYVELGVFQIAMKFSTN